MTAINFDFRIGGGDSPEFLTGMAEIAATTLRAEGSHLVLPAPSRYALSGGKAVAPNVAPSPAGGTPEWAYTVKVRDGSSERVWAFLVQVPNSGTAVAFSELPKLASVDPSMVNLDEIVANLAASAAAAESSFVQAEVNGGDLLLTRTNGQQVNLGNVEGNPGLPGVNAVPADTAVATYLGTAGSGTQAAADARYLRVIAGTLPPAVTAGSMWLNPNTGAMHYAVDRGPGPATNLATNPSFEAETQYLPIASPSTFVAASCNLRYRSLDTGVTAEKWANRLPLLATNITVSGASIVGCQESDDAGTSVSQTRQVADTLGGDWLVADGTANNGIIYRSSAFKLLVAPVTMEINRVHLQPATQRTMTYATFLHIASGRRVVFATTHFPVDASATTNSPERTEAAHIVGQMLSGIRASASDKPVVVLVGDFNQGTSIPESPYEVLAGYGIANSRGIATAVTNSGLNSYNHFDPTMTGRQDGLWVDAIMTTSDVTVPTTGLHIEFASGSSLPLATPLPSDHNMLTASVAISQIPAVRLQGGISAVTSGGGSQTYRSASWSLSGDTSLMNDPSSASSTGTAAYPAGQSGAMDRLGLTPGQTYTVSATLRLAGPQTGTTDGNARRITIGTEIEGSTNFSYALSDQAPNEAGEYPLSVTFTLPAGATNTFIRLMNGSKNEKVWWDNLIVTSGPVVVPYFDGDAPACRWEGSPHASRSIYPGPSWVSLGQ